MSKTTTLDGGYKPINVTKKPKSTGKSKKKNTNKSNKNKK